MPSFGKDLIHPFSLYDLSSSSTKQQLYNMDIYPPKPSDLTKWLTKSLIPKLGYISVPSRDLEYVDVDPTCNVQANFKALSFVVLYLR